MNKIKSGVVAAIAILSLASTFVLPTFANQTNPTQDDASISDESTSLTSTENSARVIGVTDTPNTGTAAEDKPASRINNTGLLITIAALSVILAIYSLVNVLKNKLQK